MDEIAFREKMKQDGYGEVYLREFDPDYAEDTHTHDFGASVLVLEGEISLTFADRVVTCKAGGRSAQAVSYLSQQGCEIRMARASLARFPSSFSIAPLICQSAS